MARLRRLLRLALILAAATYVGVCAYMFVIQRTLLFRPNTADVAAAAADLPGAEALTLLTADGERLNAWWKPPAEGKPTYLYLHGNGANLARRLGRFVRLTEDGAGLLAVSWRGYGGSTGAPSEDGIKADGLAAYLWLSARTPPGRIILLGESLGSGVAIWLAARKPAGLLVLDSPYASIVDLGRMQFPWLPVAALMRDPLRAIDDAPRVSIPVIAQHCTRDWIIPLSEAQRLMAAFPGRAALAVIEGRCHVPNLERGLMPKLRAALAEMR
jgi:hypothetical protein